MLEAKIGVQAELSAHIAHPGLTMLTCMQYDDNDANIDTHFKQNLSLPVIADSNDVLYYSNTSLKEDQHTLNRSSQAFTKLSLDCHRQDWRPCAFLRMRFYIFITWRRRIARGSYASALQQCFLKLRIGDARDSSRH